MNDLLNLNWNNFENNVIKSFSTLRTEKDFFDVTLVSDDEKQLEAHKLVLSACSPFFKNMFRGKSHPSSLLYLSGISSEELELVLDYIYHGEVQIGNHKLDRFLTVAKQLKLEGLLQTEHEDLIEKHEEKPMFAQHPSPENSIEMNNYDIIMKEKFIEAEMLGNDSRNDMKNCEATIPTDALQESDINEVNRRIEELLEQLEDKTFRCKSCGKVSKTKPETCRHIEIHLDGLSFKCPVCNKLFRSTSTYFTLTSGYFGISVNNVSCFRTRSTRNAHKSRNHLI